MRRGERKAKEVRKGVGGCRLLVVGCQLSVAELPGTHVILGNEQRAARPPRSLATLGMTLRPLCAKPSQQPTTTYIRSGTSMPRRSSERTSVSSTRFTSSSEASRTLSSSSERM